MLHRGDDVVVQGQGPSQRGEESGFSALLHFISCIQLPV